MSEFVAAVDAAQSGAASENSVVSYDEGPSATSDFAGMLDGFRQKADAVAENVSKTVTKDAAGVGPHNGMMKQLTDMYSYAIDTQLLVRTSGQLTTGVRQLVSGQ